MKFKFLNPMLMSFVLGASLNVHSAMPEGGVGGGGGDAEESRVNEIRVDIKKWIEQGGSKSLKLPAGVTEEQYKEEMLKYLAPKYVTVSFVEADDKSDEEKQVQVDGTAKTCRGFFSRKDNQPRILCNLERFKKTSEADQYRLIHHEYAGLAYLEKNDGAASDYEISSQLTNYLVPTVVMKLALNPVEEVKLEEIRKEEKFINKNAFDKLLIADDLIFRTKGRKISLSEAAITRVLKCTTKMIKEGRDGKRAPKHAYNFLTKVMTEKEVRNNDGGVYKRVFIIEDAKYIDQVAIECERTRKSLNAFGDLRGRGFDELREELYNIDKSQTVSLLENLLFTQVYPYFWNCINRTVVGRVGAGLEVEAGAGIISCYANNGEIRNFVGITVGAGFGVGAMASQTNTYQSSESAQEETVIRCEGFANKGMGDLALGIGTNHYYDNYKAHTKPSSNINVGLGSMWLTGSMTCGVRVFNSPRRWDNIFDRLYSGLKN